jgi:hypothetical protein
VTVAPSIPRMVSNAVLTRVSASLGKVWPKVGPNPTRGRLLRVYSTVARKDGRLATPRSEVVRSGQFKLR